MTDLSQLLDIKEQSEPLTKEGILTGRTVCITGTLTQPRNKIAELVKKEGGKVVSSVSKKLGMLIVGENAGSKLTKATELGVPIVDEDELHEILKHGHTNMLVSELD